VCVFNHLEFSQPFSPFVVLYFLFLRSNNFDGGLKQTFYFSSNILNSIGDFIQL
jgi:hypothetical protein